MSKNFLNLLATSVIVLSCGTVINSSSCYCMEDKMESKKESTMMDETNNISTNISQQDDSFNTINKTPQNNNLQVNHIPVQNTFDSTYYLLVTTAKLFSNEQYYSKNAVSQEIKNYISNIKEFYNSNDSDTLEQLMELVLHEYNYVFYPELYSNVSKLQNDKIITFSEAKEILAFDLLLHIMTVIEYDYKVLYRDNIASEYLQSTDYYYDSFYGERTKEELLDEYITKLLDSPQYKDWIIYGGFKPRSELQCAWLEIKNLICKFTELLIPKYFVLDKPETWIPREELESEITEYIQSMCKYFDSLPMVQNILTSKNIKSTYDWILKNNAYFYIHDTITKFFYKKNIQVKLKEEANKYFKYTQQAQIDRAHKESKLKDIKSEYILHNISRYIGPNKIKKAAQSFYDVIQYAVPGGFYKPGTIPYIVNSYFMW